MLEIDPVTLKIVWQYTPVEAGLAFPVDANRFLQPLHQLGPAPAERQHPDHRGLRRPPHRGHPGHEIVWEYISPYWGKMLKINMIYRAYRVPYEWVPQVDKARGTSPSSGST